MDNHGDISIPEVPFPDWKEVNKIPIVESGEALQPVSLAPEPIGIYPVYFKMGITDAIPECFLRLGVYKQLLKAASRLPKNIRLIVMDGWRPFVVQEYLFNSLIEILEHTFSGICPQKIHDEAKKFVSPPSLSISAPSPHLTGGSVDLTLADKNGQILDMGTAFDEVSDLSYTASLERIGTLDQKQITARNNRRILYRAMTDAGFTNLPSEWWHFDFGNQLWAWYKGNSQAMYGATKPSSLEMIWKGSEISTLLQ